LFRIDCVENRCNAHIPRAHGTLIFLLYHFFSVGGKGTRGGWPATAQRCRVLYRDELNAKLQKLFGIRHCMVEYCDDIKEIYILNKTYK